MASLPISRSALSTTRLTTPTLFKSPAAATRYTLRRSCPALTRRYASAHVATASSADKLTGASSSLDVPPTPPSQRPLSSTSPGGVLSRVANAVKSTFTTGSYSTPATDFGRATTWNEALKEAESLVVERRGGPVVDVKELVGEDLKDLKNNIRNLLGSGHPMLDTVSKYYFQADGKHIRPLIILLIAQATSQAPKKVHVSVKDSYEEIDTPISELSNFFIPTMSHHSKSNKDGINATEAVAVKDDASSSSPTEGAINPIYAPRVHEADQTFILPSQRRLGEIVEMIHTASLLHDDVIDVADKRRNLLSANESFGNKMAVLGGDFLLARASIALARLRNHEVTELISTVIANLVEGEFMQLRNGQVENGRNRGGKMTTFEYYMEKTYMKTASLISKSCRSSAVLGGASDEVCDIAYTYGKNIGLAFQ
ncbi:coq1 putative hexaprenyl diphosphate synthase, partial [Dissophora globulifera]